MSFNVIYKVFKWRLYQQLRFWNLSHNWQKAAFIIHADAAEPAVLIMVYIYT